MVDTQNQTHNTAPHITALVLLLAGITVLGLVLLMNNYLLFHCLVELGSAAVAACIAMIAWNTRSLQRHDYQLCLGIALAAVAIMLVLHTLSHEDMAVFNTAMPGASNQLGLLSRLWLAGALMLAPSFIRSRIRTWAAVTTAVMFAVLFTGAALHTGLLPEGLEAQGSAVSLLRGTEAAVLVMLLAALATHWRARESFNPRVLTTICSGILLALVAEICLANAANSSSWASAAGHMAQLLCFALLYWGLVRLSLSEPYTLLFHEISTNLQSLEHEANRDQLTGLYNRRGLMVLGEAQLALAQRLGLKVTVVFADLNGLKAVNDEHGHTWGDQALVDTAELLRQTFRGADVVARMGGDEFAVLLVHGNGKEPVLRLREAIERFGREANRPYRLSIAVGATVVSPGQPGSLEDILKIADAEMYTDKQEHYAKLGEEPRS